MILTVTLTKALKDVQDHPNIDWYKYYFEELIRFAVKNGTDEFLLDYEETARQVAAGFFDMEFIIKSDTDDPKDFRIYNKPGTGSTYVNNPAYVTNEWEDENRPGWTWWILGDGKNIIRQGIGCRRGHYYIDVHEGNSRGRNSDGSQFWGIEILHNKKDFRKRVNEYIAHGYVTEGIFTV